MTRLSNSVAAAAVLAAALAVQPAAAGDRGKHYGHRHHQGHHYVQVRRDGPVYVVVREAPVPRKVIVVRERLIEPDPTINLVFNLPVW